MNTAFFLMALSFILGACVASVLLDHEEPTEPAEAQAESGGGDEKREA